MVQTEIGKSRGFFARVERFLEGRPSIVPEQIRKLDLVGPLATAELDEHEWQSYVSARDKLNGSEALTPDDRTDALLAMRGVIRASGLQNYLRVTSGDVDSRYGGYRIVGRNGLVLETIEKMGTRTDGSYGAVGAELHVRRDFPAPVRFAGFRESTRHRT